MSEGADTRGVNQTLLLLVCPVGRVEACVLREKELYDFLVKGFRGRLGNPDTMAEWLRRVSVAFPDVDLVADARKALVWEAERPTRAKKDVRAFLRNWWSRSQQNLDEGSAPVISISAVKWLRKNNKSPDYLVDRWVEQRGPLTEDTIRDFCGYFGVTQPASVEELIRVYKEDN